MATLQTARHRNGTKTAGKLSGIIPLTVSYAFTAVLAADDVIQFTKLPKGAILCAPSMWFIQSADYDTSTNLTYTLRVYDGTTTKTILSASTLGQSTGIRVNGDGTGLVTGWPGFELDSDNYRLEILIAGGPSTSSSGTITVGCAYTMNDSSK